ncbi:response regulator [Rhodanobacter sp. B2A1Ga4]|jgi:Response regulator containing a CheY-like receiver domain and a GGDEF domain|uniref:response regulator n=1 Tax=Rhodanobacter sp. B2A1Ga4 TaxID=2778647 RepID=UPI001B385300|nr:response regulator [Rhodanobacter sp. B2A1Ga4]MBQ4855772.1 response regulator [Rhodanobacter sp. B2A1Ga4]
MWVLVIDDAVSNTIFITEALKMLDHRAVVSHDPLAALLLLDQMAFDCILVDFHMPSINGATFLTSLQAKLATSNSMIPVFVMTADRSPDLVTQVTNLGALTVLHKPVGISVLGAALNSL